MCCIDEKNASLTEVEFIEYSELFAKYMARVDENTYSNV